MCLTCPKHQAKGKSLNIHAPIRGGRNVQLGHMTGNPTRVGCSICGGKHSPQTHAGDSARKLPNLGKLGKGYPGGLPIGAARKIHGLGGSKSGARKFQLGR